MNGNEKNKVLITGAIHSTALETLRQQANIEVVFKPDCSREELVELVADARILVTRSETRVDASVLDHAKELKIIARAAVGVANIDIPYATERGILVINTPGKNTNAAAELTMGLILSLLRNIPHAFIRVNAGGWDRHQFQGRELRGKRIGIVGLGNVGHRVAKFAHGFDMKVYGYDPYIAPEKFSRYGVVSKSSLIDLAQIVDILTVHVPLNNETKGMICDNILSAMKPGSLIVNAARGGIVDEAALLSQLDSQHIAGAAVDTWEGEPNIHPTLSQHPCLIATPHIGASTQEAQKAIGESIVSQVLKALEGGVVDSPVNLPEIGVIDNPLVKPYAILSEKLGSLAAQLIQGNPCKIEALYRGDLANAQHALIKLAWMKGYTSRAVDSFVSFVNAENVFQTLGLTFSESQDPDFTDYRSAIKFVVHYKDGKNLSVGGLVFDETYVRISLIDSYRFEMEPMGNFIFIRNLDKPGVIGHVGSLLADKNINIDSFELSRHSQGGEALALVKIDTSLSSSTLKDLSSINHIISVHCVTL